MNRLYKTKIITFFLLAVMAVSLLLTGCSSNKETQIVAINDKKLYMADFLYDIYQVEKEGTQLEAYYQEKFGSSYWDFDYNGTTAREAAKSSVLASVVMYEILSLEAKKNGLELTQEEQAADEKATNDILAEVSSKEESNSVLTYDIIKNAIDKRTLGDKYRTELVKNLKINEEAVRGSLNPADYREYKTECLFIPTFSIKDKQITQFSKEESASALAAITEVMGNLSQQKSMFSIAEAKPELIYDTRDFIEGDLNVEDEYKAAAISLKNNEFSQVIETKYGYYIIHMLDNNSSARFEQAVKDDVKSREEDEFAKEYNKIKAGYDITINFEYWDTVKIGQITVQDAQDSQ